jgi:hypothetical protein
MKYISELLGVAIKYEPWDDYTGLPIFIHNNYEMQKAKIGNMQCLLVKPKGEPPTVPALKRHFEIIGKKVAMPRVAILENMSARQRKSLIAAQIPFIVEKTQLYLPFMGIALSERFNKPNPISETLMPSSQLLLFHYLYQNRKKFYTSGMSEKLSISRMQISRAVEQLCVLGIVTTGKEGVRVFIEGTESGSELFDKARPFMLNPVRKRLYVEKEELPKGMLFAGLTALSEYSMLAAPKIPVYAYYGKNTELHGTDKLVDNKQAEVEIWQYNPSLLPAAPGFADPLSLIASLEDVNDPRIEQAEYEIIKGIGFQNG